MRWASQDSGWFTIVDLSVEKNIYDWNGSSILLNIPIRSKSNKPARSTPGHRFLHRNPIKRMFRVTNDHTSQTGNWLLWKSGWWFQPPWKIWKSDWIIIPTMGENKIHVPNHQPEWFLDLVFRMNMAHLRLTAIHTDLPVFPRLSPPRHDSRPVRWRIFIHDSSHCW